MTYSPYIYSIADWLRAQGLIVELHADLPAHVAGRYDHDRCWVGVSGRLTALEALCAIAHEAGHWVGYLVDRHPHSFQRERQAFAYGWRVLRYFRAPVTRAQWMRLGR